MSERSRWAWFTALIGLVFLALSAVYVAENWDVVDALPVMGGAILLPAWLIWSAQTVLRVEP